MSEAQDFQLIVEKKSWSFPLGSSLLFTGLCEVKFSLGAKVVKHASTH